MLYGTEHSRTNIRCDRIQNQITTYPKHQRRQTNRLLKRKGKTMFLNQQLLQACEELFDQISTENEREKLAGAISALRNFLEKDVDGFTQYADEKLAYAVQSRLEEIWRLISKNQKNGNSNLVDAYEDILALTEDASGYEAEYPDDDEDDEDQSEDDSKADEDYE